jgi:hypothetical protein
MRCRGCPKSLKNRLKSRDRAREPEEEPRGKVCGPMDCGGRLWRPGGPRVAVGSGTHCLPLTLPPSTPTARESTSALYCTAPTSMHCVARRSLCASANQCARLGRHALLTRTRPVLARFNASSAASAPVPTTPDGNVLAPMTKVEKLLLDSIKVRPPALHISAAHSHTHAGDRAHLVRDVHGPRARPPHRGLLYGP